MTGICQVLRGMLIAQNNGCSATEQNERRCFAWSRGTAKAVGCPWARPTKCTAPSRTAAKSADYCSYCYEGGKFTFDGSMEEMIDVCVAPMVEENPGMTEQQARESMRAFFPQLKRWQPA